MCSWFCELLETGSVGNQTSKRWLLNGDSQRGMFGETVRKNCINHHDFARKQKQFFETIFELNTTHPLETVDLESSYSPIMVKG